MTSKPETCLTDGSPVTPEHRDLKENGQQKGYVVLTKEERAKGFVRPVRRSYEHVGDRPKNPLLDLTDEQKERFPDKGYGYVKYEEYPESESPVKGRYWTQKQLDSGCGSITNMDISLAETYARDPGFYSATFCVGCGKHFPVKEFVWDATDEIVGS